MKTKVKMKTIKIWETLSKITQNDIETKMSEFQAILPQFQIYSNRRNTNYSTIYEIKAKGTLEDITKYQSEQESKKLEPLKDIINILKVELEPLRIMFHEQTKNWSKIEYRNIENFSNLTQEQLREKYNRTYNMINPRTKETISRTYLSKEISEKYYYSKEVVKKGIEAFLEKAKNNAESHFQDSIITIAYKLQGEGMKIEDIKATTEYSQVDYNITTTLSDGLITAVARTIVASGPVQRPHYRYLVTFRR